MSEPQGGAPEARTARVWQPAELLKPSNAHSGFVRETWLESNAQTFDLHVVKAWTPPVPKSLDAGTPLNLALPAPELAAPEDPVAQADITLALTEAALKTERDTAYAQGLAEGQRQVRDEWAREQKASQSGSQSLLLDLDTAVRQLIMTPEALFDPLKRLALHVAEQLVLAELTLSPVAIERLVKRCVDELAPQRQTPITIELHPADLAVLQVEVGDRPWHLHANADLMPGSVRVSANDAVVADLVENRLEPLARSLLLDPVLGMAQSAFQPSRMAARLAREPVVQDAQPRMASSPKEMNLASMDLPDLNQDAFDSVKTGDTDAPGTDDDGQPDD